MKKVYNAPTTLCVKLRAANMIALSLNGSEKVTSSNMSGFEQNARTNNSWDIWGNNDTDFED